MCASQQSLMQLVLAHKMQADGDAASTDTSRWSTPSRLQCGSSSSNSSSDFEEKTSEFKSSDKWEETKKSRIKKGIKAQEPHKQKTNHNANHHILKLPSIKRPQVSKAGIQPLVDLNCIRELRSQVWDLQQQLSEAKTENKLLKRIQHRHMVALQHFENSERSISQILIKHSNEVQVLQGLLRETRACRDNLARQLQTTENKLLSTKTILQHLQLLSQDHGLLEREELTFRLTRANAQLEDKDKRTLYLEKNLELCQASFSRQIVTERKKINEARKTSCYLQEQIYQLKKEIQDRDRELEKRNIYSHRFLKGSSKKGSESKMVQTDGLVLLPTEAANRLDLKYTEETEERLEEQENSVNWCCCSPVQESLEEENPKCSANILTEEAHQEDTETRADNSEQSSNPEESPEQQPEGDCAEEEVEEEAPQVLEEAQESEEHESDTSYISETSLKTTEPRRKGYKPPKIRHSYIFKQSIENLHSGRPAYSGVDLSPRQTAKSPIRVETISSGIDELCLPAGKSRGGGVGSP